MRGVEWVFWRKWWIRLVVGGWGLDWASCEIMIGQSGSLGGFWSGEVLEWG